MTFSTSNSDDGSIRVAIEGELDAATVWDLRVELSNVLALHPTEVRIDLSALHMIDSIGVGALVAFYKRLRSRGTGVEVVGLQDQPLAIFRVLRLEDMMAGADRRCS